MFRSLGQARAAVGQLTVRAALSLRSEDARSLGGEDSRLSGVQSVSRARLVVVSGEDGSRVTGLDASLLDKLIPLPGTSLNGPLLHAAGLELGRTVADVAGCVLQHSSADGNLLLDAESSMSGDKTSRSSGPDDGRETHLV